MTLSLDVLGCHGSGPSRTQPASGYLVRTETTSVWMDAGTGTFLELGRRLDPAAVDVVTISHLHADHSSDLFGWFHHLAYCRQVDGAIPVLMPPGGPDKVAAFLGQSGDDDPVHRVLDMIEMDDGDQMTVGDVLLRFAPANHSVPCNAIRIEHDGMTLVFSGDTGLGGGFPDLARGADVVLCEAGLAGPRHLTPYPFHLSPAEAADIAEEAGAHTLVLTHRAPGLDPEAAAESASLRFSGEVIVAEPGLVIPVRKRPG